MRTNLVTTKRNSSRNEGSWGRFVMMQILWEEWKGLGKMWFGSISPGLTTRSQFHARHEQGASQMTFFLQRQVSVAAISMSFCTCTYMEGAKICVYAKSTYLTSKGVLSLHSRLRWMAHKSLKVSCILVNTLQLHLFTPLLKLPIL